jgi:predicted Zn-dependent peptidase
MAIQLADYHRLFGDWRELFRSLERIEAVTKEDVRRVAARSLAPTNRTVAQIVNRPPATPESDPGPAPQPQAEPEPEPEPAPSR